LFFYNYFIIFKQKKDEENSKTKRIVKALTSKGQLMKGKGGL